MCRPLRTFKKNDLILNFIISLMEYRGLIEYQGILEHQGNVEHCLSNRTPRVLEYQGRVEHRVHAKKIIRLLVLWGIRHTRTPGSCRTPHVLNKK